jgi:DNA polymerase III epsilon subunit-like protein
MEIFVFDVETSGIPDFKLPADDPKQPRAIQIAGILCGDAEPGEEDSPLGPGIAVRGFVNCPIRPDGWTMDDELAAKMGHGMTQAWLLENGRPVREALDLWTALHNRADLIATFGAGFDLKLMRGEFRRAGMPDLYGAKPKLDVMRAACKPCAMPMPSGRGGFKLPKLGEAAEILLGEKVEGLHNGYVDAKTTARIYYALLARGVVMAPKQDVSTKAA